VSNIFRSARHSNSGVPNKRYEKEEQAFTGIYSHSFQLRHRNGTQILAYQVTSKKGEVVSVLDRLCGLVVRVLGYRFGGPGSIPRHYQIFRGGGEENK
jgi:hypothetical protein